MSKGDFLPAVMPHVPQATGQIAGFYIRPGLFLQKGANIVPGGVSFTI